MCDLFPLAYKITSLPKFWVFCLIVFAHGKETEEKRAEEKKRNAKCAGIANTL